MDEGDKEHPDNKKLSGEGWNSLRERKRSCTDCLLLFVILASWIAMTIIGFIVVGIVDSKYLSKGNPARFSNI